MKKKSIHLHVLFFLFLVITPLLNSDTQPQAETVTVIDLTDYQYHFSTFNNNSAAAIKSALEANGYTVNLRTTFPSQLSTSAVFLCLGMFPYNHALTESQVTTLTAYLNSGGKVYMEGGDPWVYDPEVYGTTSVNTYFGIIEFFPGIYLSGADHVTGNNGTVSAGYDFTYEGFVNFTDLFDFDTSIAGSSYLWFNQQGGSGGLLGMTRDSGSSRTIGVSFEFGGIPQSLQNSIMEGYMNFLLTGATSREPAGKTASRTSYHAPPKINKPLSNGLDLDERISHHAFPKLFNQIAGYLDETYDTMLREGANWDFLVLDAELVPNLPAYLGANGILRQLNPYSVITLYFSSADLISESTSKINSGFILAMKDDWYLKDANGNTIKFFELYAGTYTLGINLTTEVNEFMPYYLNKHVLTPNLSDGIWYDWIQGNMDWLDDPGMPNNSVDIDNDGAADSDTKINTQWVAGQEELLENTWNTLPTGLLVTGNGISAAGETYPGLLNGRMLEGFQYYTDTPTGWHNIMRGVYNQHKVLVEPKLSHIMCNGTQTNYKRMRFGLTSALLFDIYYCYTTEGGYESAWWYDEYSVNIKTGKAVKDPDYKGYLGSPQTDAYDAENPNTLLKTLFDADDNSSGQKVWRRDFQYGTVLVNPSQSSKTIALGGSFKKIDGIYDTSVNDGSTVTSVTLASGSGIVLLKTPSSTLYTLTVQSSPDTGVMVTVSPDDVYSHGDWDTNFVRTYISGTTVTLTAPSTNNGRSFTHWSIDGSENTSRSVQVSMSKNRTAIAVYSAGNPAISLNRSSLNFSAVVSGASTDSQAVLIENSGTGTLNWSAAGGASWLSCAPASGTNSGLVTVSVNPSGLSAGTYTGTVTFTDANASNSPQSVSVTFTVYGSGQTAPPFGQYATPEDGSTVSSSIAVTGWVLDDVGVESVKIYSGQTYIGDAIFVEGARGDIEQAYPGYPQNYQAGWGYMLLTNFLPGGGNGVYTLNVIATDKEGKQTTLGSKTVTVDNVNAVKPFGAIDTPAQGGSASGSSFKNQGWVLTPLPNKVPEDGSTIDVYVDGVYLGHPTYNIPRSDIANYFPGYSNSDGPAAVYTLDTTGYTNGVHSIFWIATDNAGNADGIGSRFFSVQNTGTARQSSSLRSTGTAHPFNPSEIPVDHSHPITIKKGYYRHIEPQTVYPNDNGMITIEIKELERIAVRLFPAPPLMCTGYLQVGTELKPLPLGSTFDTEKGLFYWQASPGFIGEYLLTFVFKQPDEELNRLNILIKITPKFQD